MAPILASSRAAARLLRRICVAGLIVFLASPVWAHEGGSGGSDHALRFHGTGALQQDRARIPVDDDVPGAGSEPCDLGAGSFTIEFWLRGRLADNPTGNAGGDASLFDASWRAGNMLLDRHVLAGTERFFGVSVAGGFVRFGTGSGDAGADVEHTLEGDTPVLDDAWHHVACVRDAADGSVAIYVDGALDMSSAPGVSTADLSYPDAGVGGADPWGPFLVLGAEKHDSGPTNPAFDGYLDELRLWNVARSATDIVTGYWRTLPSDSAGLVGRWRFEQGAGTVLAESSDAKSPGGQLVAGVPGNGEWTSGAADPLETAGIVHVPLPPGFVRTTITAGLGPATCLEAVPDGRLFVGEHGGEIRVIDASGNLLAQPLIDIALTQSQEAQGLLGMALDPGFAANGYLYVYYTSPEPIPHNRVGRFTVTGDVADPASELVVWQNADAALDDHHGGGMCVGADGFLYIATGDNFDSANARDLTVEYGKLLRVATDGSIPALNPFTAIPQAMPTIWARGLRNPFRMSLDPNDGSLWISDVGGNKKRAQEEVDVAAPAADFGWPKQEGDHCYAADCDHFVHPVFSYAHDDERYSDPTAPTGGNQGAAILGPVYDGASFPAEYLGDLFLGDYANRWIRRLERNPQGAVVGDSPFLELPDAGPVVDLAVGADGALYYVTFPASASGQLASGTLYRIDYFAGANQPPVAIADSDATSGPAPLDVQFDASASFDPDGDPLSWSWDFGDGTASTLLAPLHSYAQAGRYPATLTAADGAESTLSKTLTIDAGNAPVVTITSPPDGYLYRAGEQLSLGGTAVDVEDGALGGSSLVWTVDLIHLGHRHPSAPGAGGNTFRIPKSGHTPEDTHFEFTLTATDSDGLPGSSTVDVYPVDAAMIFDTYPQHIPLFVDGQAEETPRPYTSLPGFLHKVEAQELYTIGGITWQFAFWTDDGKRKHTYKVPEKGGWLRAVYVPTRNRSLEVAVNQDLHCAMYAPSAGQSLANPSVPLEVTCGRASGEPLQAGFEFSLPVPKNALIRGARLVVTATGDQLGAPLATIWSYDVGAAPAFAPGSGTALTAWSQLSESYVRWDFPPFVAGVEYASPDLAPLIQQVVDEPSWSAGHAIGIVLDGGPSQVAGWRSFANFAAGAPARLAVDYCLPKKGPKPIGPMGFK